MSLNAILPIDAILDETEKAWYIDLYAAKNITCTLGSYSIWLPKSKVELILVDGGFEFSIMIPEWICKEKCIIEKAREPDKVGKIEIEEVDSIEEAFSELITDPEVADGKIIWPILDMEWTEKLLAESPKWTSTKVFGELVGKSTAACHPSIRIILHKGSSDHSV